LESKEDENKNDISFLYHHIFGNIKKDTEFDVHVSSVLVPANICIFEEINVINIWINVIDNENERNNNG